MLTYRGIKEWLYLTGIEDFIEEIVEQRKQKIV